MKNSNKIIVESFSMVLQFGLNMLVPIGMCTALGIWLGEQFHMNWLVIPFFFLGALAGYTSIFKMVKKFIKNPERPSRVKPKEGQGKGDYVKKN